MAALVPLTLPQGNDVTVDLSVFEADGVTPEDCTGLTASMYVKAGPNSDDSHAAALTIGDGLLWVSQSAGTLTAALSHTILATAGVLWWRLDLLDGQENRTTAMYGPLSVTAV